MAGVNFLLSTLPPAGLYVGGSAPIGTGVPESQGSGPSRTGLGGDTFEQGQGWKNRSQAAGENSSGEWREKAALQAYGEQAANGLIKGGGAASSEDAGNVSGEELSEGKAGVAGDEEAAQNGEPLTREEQQVVAQLRMRDVEVRAHEQAHLAAAGGYARGGASFQYQRGPDGQKYAVGGEVPIDVGKESDPAKTIRKMNVVRAAALAPASPSGQDRRIASRAAIGMSEAQRELASIRQEDAAARQEEVGQRMESALGDRAGATDSKTDDTGAANAGNNLSVRRYEAVEASTGRGNWQGVNRAV